MAKTIPQNVWKELENEGFEVRGDYSGRGMYGKTCAGFVSEEESAVKLGFLLHQLMGDDAINLVDNVRWDSMGRGTIYYFPRYTLGKSEDD
jgi:hypothetical protein